MSFELVCYKRLIAPCGNLEAGSRIPGFRLVMSKPGTLKEIQTIKTKHIEKRFPKLGWSQSFEIEEV